MEVRIGSLTQTMLKTSIGASCTRVGGSIFSLFRAYSAGPCTKSHSLSLNVRLATKAIPIPMSMRMSRAKCRGVVMWPLRGRQAKRRKGAQFDKEA